MISRLVGEIVLKSPPDLMVDVGGVGYEMQAPMSTFYRLPGVGQHVTLLTHLLVRSDAHLLYAFVSEYDRDLFRNLLKVSGVGARIALAILSGMEASTFRSCVLEGDTASLSQLPGIGRRTAERLVLEMKNRFGDEPWEESGVSSTGDRQSGDASHAAAQALMSLGYKASEARKMIRRVAQADDSVEGLIKAALKEGLGGKGGHG